MQLCGALLFWGPNAVHPVKALQKEKPGARKVGGNFLLFRGKAISKKSSLF